MNQETKRILNALLYAGAAVVAVLGGVGQPHSVLGWVGFLATAFLAGYGKYSDGANVVMPNREQWTDEERKARLQAS